MMKVTRAVQCPLPGLEAVEVVYNLMASEAQMDAFYGKVGGDGTAKPLVVEVRNWPKEMPEPFGKDAPMAWRFWASRTGFGVAMAAWLNDPDFSTASTPS